MHSWGSACLDSSCETPGAVYLTCDVEIEGTSHLTKRVIWWHVMRGAGGGTVDIFVGRSIFKLVSKYRLGYKNIVRVVLGQHTQCSLCSRTI